MLEKSGCYLRKVLKLKTKQANISGLQADLLGHPVKQWVLKQEGILNDDPAPFAGNIIEIVEKKLNRHLDAEKAFVKLKELWKRLDAENLKNPGDEAKLENRFIRPVLKDVLCYMPDAQAKTPRGRKTKHPDHALFASEQSYKDARKEHLDLAAYWSKAVAVAESKYWDCPLNPPTMRTATVRENPTTQLVGYISDIYERVLTSGRHVYGILTRSL